MAFLRFPVVKQEKGLSQPNNEIYRLEYNYSSASFSFSDKLRSFLLSYYRIPNPEGSYSGEEFICSQPDSSGMHKCSNLPPFVLDGRECYGSIETGLLNKAMSANLKDVQG